MKTYRRFRSYPGANWDLGNISSLAVTGHLRYQSQVKILGYRPSAISNSDCRLRRAYWSRSLEIARLGKPAPDGSRHEGYLTIELNPWDKVSSDDLKNATSTGRMGCRIAIRLADAGAHSRVPLQWQECCTF